MGNPAPLARAKLSQRRQHDDLASKQFGPWRQPAECVIEIDLAADVKNTLNQGKPGRMVKPGAAMKERDASHPVGVGVKHEEVEGPHLAAQQRKADGGKVAR